jgi:hypothetical protein
MTVPEIHRLEAQLAEEARQVERSEQGCSRHGDSGPAPPPISAYKRIIAATMQKISIIDDGFTGKLIISFKEGGVSYIEKVEQFK